MKKSEFLLRLDESHEAVICKMDENFRMVDKNFTTLVDHIKVLGTKVSDSAATAVTQAKTIESLSKELANLKQSFPFKKAVKAKKNTMTTTSAKHQ